MLTLKSELNWELFKEMLHHNKNLKAFWKGCTHSIYFERAI